MLNIKDVRTDGGTQSRAAINEETVAEYAEAMTDPSTVFPPIICYYDGRDYWLADGFHRLAAWERIGRVEVPAEVRQGDRRRAILHSVAANSCHGLRRSNADKRRAVTTLLEDSEWSQWSNREIARRCGVSHQFVNGLRDGASGNGCQIEEPRKVERGGKTYTVDTANIGKTNAAPAPADPVRKPSDTSEADKAGISVADVAADGPAQDDEPHDPVHADKLDADAAEPEDPATAKLRAEARKMTREALEDEWIGLRADLDEAKAALKKAEAERDDFKAKWKEATTGEDMGRALGNAQRARDTAKGRLNEELAKNARQGRRIKILEAEVAKLQKDRENEEVEL